jgi:hypothetical protein
MELELRFCLKTNPGDVVEDFPEAARRAAATLRGALRAYHEAYSRTRQTLAGTEEDLGPPELYGRNTPHARAYQLGVKDAIRDHRKKNELSVHNA